MMRTPPQARAPLASRLSSSSASASENASNASSASGTWETVKENYQPIKGGRKVGLLDALRHVDDTWPSH